MGCLHSTVPTPNSGGPSTARRESQPTPDNNPPSLHVDSEHPVRHADNCTPREPSVSSFRDGLAWRQPTLIEDVPSPMLRRSSPTPQSSPPSAHSHQASTSPSPPATSTPKLPLWKELEDWEKRRAARKGRDNKAELLERLLKEVRPGDSSSEGERKMRSMNSGGTLGG